MPWTIAIIVCSKRLEIDGRIDLAALDGAAEIAAEHLEHLLHVLHAGHARPPRCAWTSAQISANSGAALVSWMCLIWAIAPCDHAVDDVGIAQDRRKKLGVVGAVGLADRLDDRFLGGEVAIERAGAHAGLGADLLHRGALEAGAHEAGLGRFEDALDLQVAAFGAGARMLVGIDGRRAFRQRYRELPWILQPKKSERSFSIYANDHSQSMLHCVKLCCRREGKASGGAIGGRGRRDYRRPGPTARTFAPLRLLMPRRRTAQALMRQAGRNYFGANASAPWSKQEQLRYAQP